jgi:NAD(P)H-dependent FMN reductase
MGPKVLVFAGSARSDSYNKKLARVAAVAARAAGAEVTYLDLRELPLPLYDGDAEARDGLPENARKLKDVMLAHDGLLIASPEYNSSITPLLKNTIDWASRPVAGEPELACFTGKVVGLVSASPGALGGLRALVHVRSILGNIGCLVVPEQIAIPRAHEAFHPDGTLKEARQQQGVEKVAARVVDVLKKLKA